MSNRARKALILIAAFCAMFLTREAFAERPNLNPKDSLRELPAGRLNGGRPIQVASATPSGPPSVAANLPINPGPLTFQAWKTLRVEEARLVLERMMLETQIRQQTMQLQKNGPGPKPVVLQNGERAAARNAGNARVDQRAEGTSEMKADGKVQQARINLEIAHELTMTDYLHIYLSQVNTPDALNDMARRMTPEEVTELLVAFKQSAQPKSRLADAALSSTRLCSGALPNAPVVEMESR